MRIMVIGTGAIGSLYGGWLLSGGAHVAFVARGARHDQIRDHGIVLTGPSGETTHRKVIVVRDPRDLPPADVLLVAVKTYDLESAARDAIGAVSTGGLVVGVQNGVGAAAMLGASFDPEQVMVGPVYSAAKLGPGGTVRLSGQRNDVVIGNMQGTPHPAAELLVAFWRKAGVTASISDDIQAALWT
ncbi:MAG TPA: 2-dehydropantoate 2-reductase N-terminal domain-containing protein, partial [Sphingomicrobium sp.]|nr:2-dehydropantoate 2-reductase N-terminal domain-containing protein [Sphingomicrobium sp.]